ncbi:MAG TPA: tetratricopeptide repeat protein, partial [Burkholderiaceae bacterium]|nr:tetratricopeptide repeat protein [Burkholderiaceae bacterium]
MAYDLEEQEQLDNLKEFWRKYGGFILTVLLVVALAFAGWRGWQWYQMRNAAQAAQVYDQLREAVAAQDLGKVRDAAGRIVADYPGTAWAQMAALTAADVYVEHGDAKAARIPLQWAIDNADDAEYQQLARLRLAGLLLDEKDYDAALAAIDPGSVGKPGAEMAGSIADRRGDIL